MSNYLSLLLLDIRQSYQEVHHHESFYKRVLMGVFLLFVALSANYAANAYVGVERGSSVADLLLDHLPIVVLNDLYLEGFYVLIGSIVVLGLHRPQKVPFLLKTIALFVGIRSFFIILTHLAPPLSALAYTETYAPVGGMMQRMSSGNDLFFSGHTGLPFLMALMFWSNRSLRVGFLLTSLVFGAAVLLAHLHYSIDVFAAFFITYSIFQLAKWYFQEDYELFLAKRVPLVNS